MERAEIAVIGAGAAGLAAFQRLRAEGCDAVLIEARLWVGGRIRTRHPSGWPLPVELGAEFIHGAPPELMPLADADPPSRGAWSGSGGRLRAAGFSGADRVFTRMRAIRPPKPDCSFAAFLARCGDVAPAARARALGYIEGFEAADPERISVYSLNREREAHEAGGGGTDGEGPRRPRGGYDGLLATLRAPGRRALGTVVHLVRWRPGEVEIIARCRGSRVVWRVRRAIVTLPLSVLQRSIEGAAAPPAPVRFDPPLDPKRAALAGLAMGAARRITLRLREPVWSAARDREGRSLHELGFLFGDAPGLTFPTWWTAPGRVAGPAQITGWAAGRCGWAVAARPTASLRNPALADLAALLGLAPDRIASSLLAIHSHDWQADPYALGAYSYATVGGSDAHAALAAPLDHTLFFAGEATDASGNHATVQGALRSGRRAAVEALG